MSSHQALELAGVEAQLGQQFGDQIIVADIGSGIYAIPVDDLVEVEHIPNVAPVPHTEDWLHGVVNLRGSILTLIDPARMLAIGTWRPSPQSRMLVVGRDDPVALAVDRLRGMRQLRDTVPPDLLEEMPGRVAEYVEVVYRDGDRFISVLNVKRLLDDAERASHRPSESMPYAGGRLVEGDVSKLERGAS